MRERCHIIFVALLFSFSLHAQSVGRVKEINPETKQLAIVVGEKEIGVSDSLVVDSSSGRQCTYQLKEFRGKSAILNAINCNDNDFNGITLGQEVRVSMFEKSKSAGTEQNSEKPSANLRANNNQQSQRRSKKEPWYVHIGIGLSSMSYEADTKEVVDEIESVEGVDNFSMMVDLFGLYFPFNNHKTLFGANFNMALENWSYQSRSIQLTQYLISASSYHYFGQGIGDGFFVRGDLGIAWYNIDIDFDVIEANESTDKGLGLLAGVGYAVPISRETRMQFGVNYAHRNSESSSIGTWSATIGFLF